MRLTLLVLSVCLWVSSGQIVDEEEAVIWLEQYNEQSEVVLFNYVNASWTYNTNLTDENLEAEVSFVFKESVMK